MSVLSWIVLAAIVVAGTAAFFALAIGRLLGEIGNRVSELIENEHWSAAPPRRSPEYTF